MRKKIKKVKILENSFDKNERKIHKFTQSHIYFNKASKNQKKKKMKKKFLPFKIN